MLERLQRLLPTPQAIAANRWLRWLGPALHHPRLWHMRRRGIALGMAIGVFFGFLIPVAQIPASAAVAVALRANLPTAMASTLVTKEVVPGAEIPAGGAADLPLIVVTGERLAPAAAELAVPRPRRPG